MAKTIANKLVRELDENHRDTVAAKAMMCISLRKEWAKRYTWAPRHMLVGHQMYIGFLTGIHQQVTALKENETAAIHVRDQQADEQKIAEDGETDLREQQADEQEVAEDCQTDLTPGQADFLAFLECLIILAREAARLFEDVAQGKLPIWTASTLSNVILRRAENLIHVTRLLNDEEAPRTIWATSASGWDGGLSAPQLAQDWVDGLDKASDRRPTIWGEMTTLLPEIWNCLDSLVAPSLSAAANAFNSGHQPYAFQMLRHSFLALRISTPTSVAQVPLVSLIGAYFCRLVTRKTNDERSGLVDMSAAREEVSAEMNENLAILFRLLKQNALTQEQVDSFRSTTEQMKLWARACSEPMSLGMIHAFARTHWVNWHVRIVGSNSVPVQIFLYLCEKRRLQSSEDTLGGSEYEDLVGALLEDQRVAPHLLMNGRPKTVSECINALRHWCHLPTLNGDTLGEGGPGLTQKHIEAIENSSIVRNTTLLHEHIAQNGFCITKTMYARLSADIDSG